MSQRKVKDAKDLETEELIYFKGHAKATYMSDGRSVEEAIRQAGTDGGGSGGIVMETDPIFSASAAAKITDGNITSWNGKQDKISDLDSIRSNANKGAEALGAIPKKVSELENDKGYLTEHQDISNLATKNELQDKVDKVDGKQLSTEDFTTALKNKLSGLNNYDDTAINQAVQSLQTQLNTLTGGNTSSAVESFNEIVAFLEGIDDSQSLDGIIASIEQQIAGKMDKVTLAAVATSGNYNDLSNKPTIPTAVTESTVSGWGFTKNTGTYSKPSTGIPKTDLASAVQTSLGKADTALQEEQYKGTVATKDADMVVEELWDASFEILPNGSIKVTANGISKEFMSATPSGDPMHNVYVNVGAEYNDTGEDIVRTSIYGDSIVWKNAHWWLNDLGDITNDEMRDIYVHANITQAAKVVSNMMQGIGSRTNIATWTSTWNGKIIDNQLFGYCTSLKTALFRQSTEHYLNTNVSWLFVGCASLEKVFPTLNATSTTSFNGAFDSCTNLKEIRIKALGTNCSFVKSNLLSNASILYMIKNSNSAKAITITFHADAYNRAMADSEIVEALNKHTNVTLAKA